MSCDKLFGNYLGYEEAHKSMVVVWSLMGCGLCNFPAWYYYLRVWKDQRELILFGKYILVGNTYLPLFLALIVIHAEF